MENINITSVEHIYLEGVKIGVKVNINGQELFVPIDPANRHYAEIMRQVEAGELVIEDAAP